MQQTERISSDSDYGEIRSYDDYSKTSVHHWNAWLLEWRYLNIFIVYIFKWTVFYKHFHMFEHILFPSLQDVVY